jgi:hypothetical protein
MNRACIHTRDTCTFHKGTKGLGICTGISCGYIVDQCLTADVDVKKDKDGKEYAVEIPCNRIQLTQAEKQAKKDLTVVKRVKNKKGKEEDKEVVTVGLGSIIDPTVPHLCTTYANPDKKWGGLGCPFAKKHITSSEGKMLNPIKASKRKV